MMWIISPWSYTLFLCIIHVSKQAKMATTTPKAIIEDDPHEDDTTYEKEAIMEDQNEDDATYEKENETSTAFPTAQEETLTEGLDTNKSTVAVRSIQVDRLSDGRGGYYYSRSGIIRHPLTGGNYQNNEICIWRIWAETPITIRFVRFNLERRFDYLYVRDGQYFSDNVLGNFTGSVVPSPIHTKNNVAYLLFATDGSVTRPGFELHWDSNLDCGGKYYSKSGIIRHPSSGGNYRNFEKCIWEIMPSSNLVITFVSFNTESCCDSLQVRDVNRYSSTVIGRFRGNSVPSPLRTRNGGAHLIFTSDRSVTYSGFELRWESS